MLASTQAAEARTSAGRVIFLTTPWESFSMGRLVSLKRKTGGATAQAEVSKERMTPTEPEGDENYATRVAKYIPGEIVAGYTSLTGLANGITADSWRTALLWGLFYIGLVATPVYLVWTYKPKGQQVITVILSTVLFVFWAYGLGGPFELAPASLFGLPYNSQAAGVLLGIVSWLSGMFVPKEGA
jgi:hypothetical protein